MDTFIAMQDRLWKTYQRRRRALVDIAAGASDGSTIPDIRVLPPPIGSAILRFDQRMFSTEGQHKLFDD